MMLLLDSKTCGMHGHISAGVVPLISSDNAERGPSMVGKLPEGEMVEKHGNCIFIVYCIIPHLRGGVLEFVFLFFCYCL